MENASDPRVPLAAWYLRGGTRRLILIPMTEAVALFLFLLLLRGASEDPRTNLRESTAAAIARQPAPVATVSEPRSGQLA